MYNRDVMSANFRALFSLHYNQWAKSKKSPEQLWQLSIDGGINNLTEEEMYERNKKVIQDHLNRHKN